MNPQQVFDEVKGDRHEFLVKYIQNEWPSEDASAIALKVSRLGTFDRYYRDVAPKEKKNLPKAEKMRVEYSPHEQGKLKMKKMVEIARGIKEDKEINLTMNLQ